MRKHPNATMTWFNVAGNTTIPLQRISEFSKDQNEGSIPVQDWYNENLWLSQKLHLSENPALRNFHLLFLFYYAILVIIWNIQVQFIQWKWTQAYRIVSLDKIITDQTRWSGAK